MLLFALLGLGASSTSAWVHSKLLNNPGYTSFCDFNSTVSCTDAYLSPYGSLFGTPVALFGVLWFAAVVALLLAGRPGTRLGEHVSGYVFALSTVGLAMVLYLAYGAFVVLKAVCVLCILTYAAVLGLFVVSGVQTRFSMTSLPQRLFKDLRAALASPAAMAALAVFVVGAASAIAFFPKESDASGGTAASAQGQDQRAEVERWFDSQPRQPVPVGETGGASVVIVKFNDYQCPPCRQTYLGYKPILAKYMAQAPGKILYITKDFPLDPECNVNTPRGSHTASCEAAVAARLARRINTGDKLEDWLFANQATLTGDNVKQAAKDVGGVNDFEAKYAQTLEQVKADVALGKLLGVDATPTFFINGVKISGGLQPQFLDTIIAHELSKASK